MSVKRLLQEECRCPFAIGCCSFQFLPWGKPWHLILLCSSPTSPLCPASGIAQETLCPQGKPLSCSQPPGSWGQPQPTPSLRLPTLASRRTECMQACSPFPGRLWPGDSPPLVSEISLLCELRKHSEDILHAPGSLSARERDQPACCRAGRCLAMELSPFWLLCPAGLEMQGSLLVSSSSLPNLQVALRNKGRVGMEWGPGVFSILLLWLGHVYTLAIGMQSSQPEFAPVSAEHLHHMEYGSFST